MLNVKINDRALRRNLDRYARRTPELAQDAMLHAILGFRKEFLANLRPRIPGLVKAPRGRSGGLGGGPGWLWVGRAWISKSGSIIGKFRPRKYRKTLLMLETGGVVRDPSGSMAIPTGAARTAGGRVKKGWASPAMARRAGKRLRFLRAGGRAYLVGESKRGKLGKVYFALRRQVKIPASLGLYRFWRAAQTRFFQRLEKSLRKKIRGTFQRKGGSL